MVALCVMLTGCMKYRITLTDGTRFTVLGKPKYDEVRSLYLYKSGWKEHTISSGRVASIEPSADAEQWDD
jgi:hypothetical protein